MGRRVPTSHIKVRTPGLYELIEVMWERAMSVILSAVLHDKLPEADYQYFLHILSDEITNEPPHGKTNNLHRRKQGRRSASR